MAERNHYNIGKNNPMIWKQKFNKSLLYDENNLITLCNRCHKYIHELAKKEHFIYERA
jgi:5-methylcytosine-specific restriction endonuclease McrA